MFYPEILPEATPEMAPADALALEFDAVCLLLQADGDLLRSQSAESLAQSLLDELEFCGSVTSVNRAAAAALIRGNASVLSRFVQRCLLSETAPTPIQWLHPDAAVVIHHLGAAANAEWQKRAADEGHAMTTRTPAAAGATFAA